MKKFIFNDNTQALEIDPGHLKEGLTHAEKKNYTAIRIMALNLENGISSLELNLTPLTNSTLIQSLSIDDNFKISKITIDAIYTLSNLTHLSLSNKKIKLDFSRLPKLKELYIQYDNISTDLSSLKNLEHLLVVSAKNDDCSFLKDLSSIKTLRISGGILKNLSGVEQLSNLVNLRIDHCPKLESIITITKLSKLENLHVEKCKLLNDYVFLSGNSSIKKLFISELDSISFVANMKSLELLHFWNLRDGDLSHVLKSSSLKTVQFYPNKKNYSHTHSEINDAITCAKSFRAGRSL